MLEVAVLGDAKTDIIVPHHRVCDEGRSEIERTRSQVLGEGTWCNTTVALSRLGHGVHFAADPTDCFLKTCEDETQLTGATIHDACAAAWIINPNLIESASMHIDVELKGELTRGMTVCDYRHLQGPTQRSTSNIPGRWITGAKSPMWKLPWSWTSRDSWICSIRPHGSTPK